MKHIKLEINMTNNKCSMCINICFYYRI